MVRADDAVDAVLPLGIESRRNDPNWLRETVFVRGNARPLHQRGRHLRVLEVGAAKAWGRALWLERKLRVRLDRILVDDKIGLGRGAFYGDFGRVQAGRRDLPFADADIRRDVLRRHAATTRSTSRRGA